MENTLEGAVAAPPVVSAYLMLVPTAGNGGTLTALKSAANA